MVLRPYSPDVMLSAVRLVLSGGVYIPPMMLGQVSAAVPAAVTPAMASPESIDSLRRILTERQVDVLRLLSQGKPNKLICRELDLAEGTVKIHVAAVLRALNVNTRSQAVVEASRLGLRLDGVLEHPDK